MASPAEPMPAGETRAAWAGRWLAGPRMVRLAVLLAAAAASALGAWLGAWWVPFLVGLAAGALRRAGAGDARAPGPGRTRRPRGALLPAVGGAILGWAIPIWALALDGQPVGATARAMAALGGLPPYAGVMVTVTLLLAALQVLAGAWLARAVFPGSALGREGTGTQDPGDSQP
jgi:hypothetical protein